MKNLFSVYFIALSLGVIVKKSDKDHVEIRIEPNGDAGIADFDAFLALPEVQRKMKVGRDLDLVGKKLVGFRIVPQDDPLFAKDAEPEKTPKKP